MNPKISIITICYNCKDDIEPTILSVINQSYPNVEYIIIDGGSSDGTLDIINKYRNSINVLITEPDKGIFDAMNKGLRYATGTWVNFMNAGDTFHNPETLKNVFQNKDNSDVGVLYGNTITGGELHHPKELSTLKYGEIMACHQSIFYNREICGNELFYKTKHKHYGDIELTRRLYIKGVLFKQVYVTISDYKGGGFSSIVSNAARMAKFSYLYQSFGVPGIFYGIAGKLFYLRAKYLKSKK